MWSVCGGAVSAVAARVGGGAARSCGLWNPAPRWQAGWLSAVGSPAWSNLRQHWLYGVLSPDSKSTLPVLVARCDLCRSVRVPSWVWDCGCWNWVLGEPCFPAGRESWSASAQAADEVWEQPGGGGQACGKEAGEEGGVHHLCSDCPGVVICRLWELPAGLWHPTLRPHACCPQEACVVVSALPESS